MIFIISPAKSLDMKPQQIAECSLPSFLEKSAELAKIMKGYTPTQIADLMGISSSLARTNAERYLNWNLPFTKENAKQAIFAFSGEVYRGLNIKSFSDIELQRAQQKLRILSGLYGVLRPLDLIQPYRLEMGTRLSNPAGTNLYAYWTETITDILNQDVSLQPDKTLINLASEEYSKAVNFKKINGNVISPVFLESKNGKPRIIAVYAKKARGLMCAFALKNDIQDPEDLKTFDYEGYEFSEQYSSSGSWAFIR
jgi:uncharacterized protein